MNTKHSRSTDERNLRNIYKDIVIIYIYIRFGKYLQLQLPQKPIKHSTIHPKSILPANSQINYPLAFFFLFPGCFSPWVASLAYENSGPQSGSTYPLGPSIRIRPSIKTFIIITHICPLYQAKYVTQIILFHPHKPPCKVSTVVISI